MIESERKNDEIYLKVQELIETVKQSYSSNNEKFGCLFVFLLHTLINTQQSLFLGKILFYLQ